MPKVEAYVYDVSMGMAKGMSMAMVGQQIDLLPHTGIVVFGTEFYFGGGPATGQPGQCLGQAPVNMLDLGETSKSRAELEAFIAASLVSEYTEAKYDLLNHNCNHYADEIAKFLLDGKGLPEDIVNIGAKVGATPQGKALLQQVDMMQKSAMQSGGSMNPYGNQGGGGPAFSMPGAAAASVPAAAAPVADVVDPELEAALTEIRTENGKEAQRTCLTMLVRVCENVVKSPGEAKFRVIKMASKAFTEKIEAIVGGMDAFMALGWLPDSTPEGEDIWQCGDDVDLGRLKKLSNRVSTDLAKLGPDPNAKPAAAPPAAAPPAQSPPGGYGGGMPGMGGMGGGGGMPDAAQMQQMMNNPAAMQQAQQMMQGNPQMMEQAQQMMQNPQAMAQMQQMMQSNPQMMAQMQNMMGGQGR